MRGPSSIGLDAHSRFEIRYDVPSECARLLHAHDDRRRTDSVDRVPARATAVRDRAGPAVTSRGPVASVAIFTRANRATFARSRWTRARGRRWRWRTILLRSEFGVDAGSGADGAGPRRRCSRGATPR